MKRVGKVNMMRDMKMMGKTQMLKLKMVVLKMMGEKKMMGVLKINGKIEMMKVEMKMVIVKKINMMGRLLEKKMTWINI